jgi:Flp pilus assembly protein TadG
VYLQPPRPARPGATLVEFAIVLSLLLILTLGVVVLGLGVFRYQQMALLAREGTRWASVHGGQYYQEQGKTAYTKAVDVYNNAIQPMMVGLDPNKLSYSVTWSDPAKESTGTTVTVMVSYTWVPEFYLLPSITLSSTSVATISY